MSKLIRFYQTEGYRPAAKYILHITKVLSLLFVENCLIFSALLHSDFLILSLYFFTCIPKDRVSHSIIGFANDSKT